MGIVRSERVDFADSLLFNLYGHCNFVRSERVDFADSLLFKIEENHDGRLEFRKSHQL